jgi:predicted regulator of Ras-like GTPase activity (Roadblock/LC7/MglB family)
MAHLLEMIVQRLGILIRATIKVVRDAQEICEQLLGDCQALAVLLADKSGQAIAGAGQEHGESLSVLLAGDLATIERIFAERTEHFRSQVLDGARTHLHVSLIAERAILAVLFDERSSLGLVRLRVKKATEELAKAFVRGPSGGSSPAALKITLH